MDRILVSACLLGRPVRYNGTAKTPDKACEDGALLTRWQQEGRVVAFCPEIAVGFPTPRPPAEMTGALDGAEVLAGRGRVEEQTGGDVTALYLQAAQDTVAFAQQAGCRFAVLTDGSPSCGSTFVYDGTFRGQTRAGQGTTTAALRAAGIEVWAETQLRALADRLL